MLEEMPGSDSCLAPPDVLPSGHQRAWSNAWLTGAEATSDSRLPPRPARLGDEQHRGANPPSVLGHPDVDGEPGRHEQKVHVCIVAFRPAAFGRRADVASALRLLR
jgi:hypothetical protein